MISYRCPKEFHSKGQKDSIHKPNRILFGCMIWLAWKLFCPSNFRLDDGHSFKRHLIAQYLCYGQSKDFWFNVQSRAGEIGSLILYSVIDTILWSSLLLGIKPERYLSESQLVELNVWSKQPKMTFDKDTAWQKWSFDIKGRSSAQNIWA